ncbi:D-alanine--D-alanine ligase [Enterobacteriaceae endosymbiont of Macroplea appendiculata]|uniref:D-alanine--D-alanine ligase n=1 Tax=Enterobacteriaceae endosymbiont of Macroplea appendiculata TaxID=2675790 RepID=UPI001448B2F1|nr:D-alanine--D-alanine ligase [Enterobacteriaceae endosymbiont of Macroplea appendiculata]QJC30769.1 D-alanine--D-alanine ligase [Enterobacteriaceae endosymbiont of Macroplea appendiculata]
MTKKIAVLYGGNSLEREISLKTGKRILSALHKLQINAHGLDLKTFPIFLLKNYGFTNVFIAVHGKGGEDGKIQSILDYMKLPYTGSRMLPSAITMNKHITKMIWKAYRLPIYPHFIVQKKNFIKSNFNNINKQCLQLTLPCIIKPNYTGSSIGVVKINHIDDLIPEIEIALQYSNEILIEQFILGTEYTVGILKNFTLPTIKIVPQDHFYNYHNKYYNNNQYFCPSGLSHNKESELSKLVLKAWQVLGCEGWGRIDVIMDQQGHFNLLEVNTIPGMTKKSLYPQSAKQYGLSFKELVLTILDTAR